MESTGNRREVSVSVNIASSLPSPSVVDIQFFPTLFILWGVSCAYIIALVLVREKFEHENRSPYMVLMIISFIALIMDFLVGSFILSLKYFQSLSRRAIRIRFSILDGICVFLGFIANISLLLVYCLPQNLVWVGYLVLFLILVIAVACYWFFPEERDVSDRRAANYSVNYSLMIAAFPNLLTLHLPKGEKLIRYSVIGATLVILAVYNCIAYINSSNKKDGHSVEAHQVIPENIIP